MRYSLFNVIVNGLTGNRFATPAWRDPEPRPSYDVIIVGGGGHGLATAYYLAKHHGVRNVAVIEKGWIGSGNAGRNTTIFRSNYLLPGNEPFYEWSVKLWEGLEQELNYNVMASQRGIVNLIHSDGQRDAYVRRGNAMRLAGADSELLDREQVRALAPFLDFDNARFPIKGGLLQARAGTARHDAVVWGYARGADQLGVDILQNCEVTGFLRDADGAVTGVETIRGTIRANKVALAVAGSSSRLASKLGLRLPIESLVLQAFVSEGVKPLVPGVITFGAGHFYISQSDKGGLVFGGDIDGYNSYAQRGNLPVIEDVLEGGMAVMPLIGRLRLLRQWAGLCDMTMDGSPIFEIGPLPGLYLNAGWNYGGFKATPASGWCFAHMIARDEPHPLIAEMRLDRFRTGHVIDEKGVGAQPNLH
ncbi:sarcosine oxidase subunit beta family protein [Rhodoblastus sp. 17X3]|uniref:sarcosine oxidase subunit beta family protein n=1 Tax=Rhodoblastus sp. 17X3 TaxID=3047026 RepID=UPI0024B64F8B|nr:sarcosine oxidase subunit beta family protein [Rhodoblastus sp. 17X3]MDI9850134.1 sarcosine oxidase subunit beta family protein [Rhodoblastus sp. 17X3]